MKKIQVFGIKSRPHFGVNCCHLSTSKKCLVSTLKIAQFFHVISESHFDVDFCILASAKSRMSNFGRQNLRTHCTGGAFYRKRLHQLCGDYLITSPRHSQLQLRWLRYNNNLIVAHREHHCSGIVAHPEHHCSVL